MDRLVEVRDASYPEQRISSSISHLHYRGAGIADYLRFARIVLDSFRLGLPNVAWYVMTDDDTLVNVDALALLLSRYNADQFPDAVHWTTFGVSPPEPSDVV